MTDTPALVVTPPAFLADRDVALVLDALPGARVVGGAVRDTLAGLTVADIDVASPLPPEDVLRRLAAAGLRGVPTGLPHGTVTAVTAQGPIEITTLRQDLETDGRHAVVAFTADWRADAARRDFTINAMSMRADGAVFDYFGGIADLRAHRVRFVGDPAARIAEDYLRVLRFFRFYARYGGETPDRATAAALTGGIAGFSRLSAERVWSELKRILLARDPVASVKLMASLGVLQAVIPEGTDPDALARLVRVGAPDDPLLRIAALLAGNADAFADRLRLSAEERETIVTLRAGPSPDPGATDAALRCLLADEPAERLIGRVWLADDGTPGWSRLRERLGIMPRPVFPLSGRDVVALGVPPGPRVGTLLRDVRNWWMSGGCLANYQVCLGQLKHYLS